MSTLTHSHPRLAVIYDGAAGPKVYRIAVEIAARAWDAGSGVRVRRLGKMVVPAGSASHPGWRDMLDEAADVPEAGPADFAWANVAVVLRDPDDLATSLRHLRTLRMLARG